MKTLRWDTVHELPPDVDGKTRLAPPRTESRNQLKRLYAQQNWTELLEQADLMFSTGVSHFWLDIQWYLHQALAKAGAPWDRWTAVIRQDWRCCWSACRGWKIWHGTTARRLPMR